MKDMNIGTWIGTFKPFSAGTAGSDLLMSLTLDRNRMKSVRSNCMLICCQSVAFILMSLREVRCCLLLLVWRLSFVMKSDASKSKSGTLTREDLTRTQLRLKPSKSTGEIIGKPQEIMLPFPCEERILKSEIQCNHNKPFAEHFPERDTSGGQCHMNKQHHCVSVDTICEL